MPPLRWLLVLPLLAACGGDCVEMCQHYARYVDECGLDWPSAFPDEDWDSVQDCYDDHWDVSDRQAKECVSEARTYSDKACW